MAVGLLVCLSAAAVGQGRPIVSNVFFQTDLRQALEDVAAQAQVNIIADPMVQGVVSVTLDEVTVAKALELLLAGTEYQVHVAPDYYLVYSSDDGSEVFASVADTRIVMLQYIAPDAARSLLPPPLQRYVRVNTERNALAITAPVDLMARIQEDLSQIDQPSQQDTAFIPMTHVRAVSARSMLPEDLQRFVRAEPDRNVLAITAPRGTLEKIVAQINQLDVPLAPGSFDTPDVHRTKVVKLNHAKAVSTLNLLPVALHDYVRADEESNTLAVSAPSHLLQGIMTDIAAIDVPRQHIMLDARVVILEQSDLLDFGADWQLPKITAGAVLGSAVSGLPWELAIGYSPSREFTNALSLTLNLLTQNEQATIIASPQVLAQDGREAEIKVTTEEYFQITAEAGAFLSADLEKIETGTILRITPQVGPNGELTLDMNIEVSDVIARGDENLPVVSRRTARSTVQLESGGTAAIAGLVDSRAQFGRAGVPAASSLPLLGRAFRTDTLNHQARQVAVFVTATLVNDHGQRFETGRAGTVSMATAVDEDQFRSELEAALMNLGVTR